MPSKSAILQGTLSCTIDASPNPVDAGAELTITARVVCDPPCDLTGDTLSIRDADGRELATITFTEFNDETFESAGTVSLVAPDTVGDYAWSAVIEAFSADDADFETVSVPLAFAVKAHTTRINVWDTPPAIGLGERFAIKVGVKCTCGCTLAGQPFTVHDDTGAEIAAGVLGADILPLDRSSLLCRCCAHCPNSSAARQSRLGSSLPSRRPCATRMRQQPRSSA